MYIIISFSNISAGALMAFFDGWELNGKYFPNEIDHHLSLEQRSHEFCNHNAEWPFRQLRKRFRSSQNAALLQYRIPIKGSWVGNFIPISNHSLLTFFYFLFIGGYCEIL